MELDYFGILMRWLHILPALAMVGGTLYMRLAVVPATQSLADDQRKSVTEILRSRWAWIVHISILCLLLSGVINLMRIVSGTALANPGLYHSLFGVKFLMALTIFFIASVLMGTSSLAEKFRQNAKRWLSINLTLAVLVVCISGVLRAIDKSPKPAEPESRLRHANSGPSVAGTRIDFPSVDDSRPAAVLMASKRYTQLGVFGNWQRDSSVGNTNPVSCRERRPCVL